MTSIASSLSLFVILMSGSAHAHVLDNISDGGRLPDGGKIWVLLVAGSREWYNYRHQADVCHAYQVVHSHGIPDENIVVMMFDDIANNTMNPTPGTILNRPDGPNVYKGVPHDYTHTDNNPQNFLRILGGEDMTGVGSEKTIASGPNDHVFVYFADHGAPGLVAFDDDFLKATDLNEVIKKMHAAKKFKKLVFYIEACESGSMFNGLLKPSLDTFATTAANGQQSSYACNWDDKLQVFLGDVYSVKWLEDSDHENLEKETLEDQYRLVKHETNTSQVCQFGDLSLAKMPVAEFQGQARSKATPSNYWDSCLNKTVPSWEVTRLTLEKKLFSATSGPQIEELATELKALHADRERIESTTRNIVKKAAASGEEELSSILLEKMFFADTPELTQHDCYYQLVDAFHAHCFNLGKNEWALRQLLAFANLCEGKYDVEKGLRAIKEECAPGWAKMPKIELVH